MEEIASGSFSVTIQGGEACLALTSKCAGQVDCRMLSSPPLLTLVKLCLPIFPSAAQESSSIAEEMKGFVHKRDVQYHHSNAEATAVAKQVKTERQSEKDGGAALHQNK